METKSSGLKEQMYTWLLSELQEAEGMGRSFSVEGEPYTVAEADELYQVMEEAYYMKSYIPDAKGRIVQVDFEKIKTV